MKRLVGTVLALAIAVGAVGCGDDSKSEAPKEFAPKPTKGPSGAPAPGAPKGKAGQGGAQAPPANL